MWTRQDVNVDSIAIERFASSSDSSGGGQAARAWLFDSLDARVDAPPARRRVRSADSVEPLVSNA